MIEIASRYGRSPMKRRDIVRTQKVSDSYLENILISLRDAGMIKAIRGARGGYVLTRPPEQITLLEIVAALEGDLAPVECLVDPGACDLNARCRARSAWKRLHAAQTETLGAITLKELVRGTGGDGGDYVI
jgi:Rrf2 family protein